MDADYDIFEIIAVLRDFWLIDSESYQRRYCTSYGKPLGAGYYVVNWPEHIRKRRFNEHAAFHGPFNSRKEAEMAYEWMYKEWAHQKNLQSLLSPGIVANPNAMLSAKPTIHQADVKAGGATEAAVRSWEGWKPWFTGFAPSAYGRTVKIAEFS